jgi:ATP-dependent DNA helicase RecG
LLKTLERIEEQFNARVVENEIEVDLFRVPFRNFDRRAFREALINALVHRDYTRLWAIHVQWTGEGILISNPGGFVEGVTLDNLLVVAPRPRNPLLADAEAGEALLQRLAQHRAHADPAEPGSRFRTDPAPPAGPVHPTAQTAQPAGVPMA